MNSETLAISIIEKTGPEAITSATNTREPTIHIIHIPALYNRNARADWEKSGSKDMVQRTREKANKLLKDHSIQPP